jgi:hypothetical protein
VMNSFISWLLIFSIVYLTMFHFHCVDVFLLKIFNLIRRRQSYNITAQNDKITRITHENIHSLVLDCSPFGFMDAMGVKTLQQVH